MAGRAPCDVDVNSQRENITSISGDFGEAVVDVKPLMIVPCWSESGGGDRLWFGSG
jgi:hypothetical protein